MLGTTPRQGNPGKWPAAESRPQTARLECSKPLSDDLVRWYASAAIGRRRQ
jgi:hypothetical protein